MNPEILGLCGIALLLVLLFAGMWVGLAMAFIGLLGIFLIQGFYPAATIASIVPFQNVAYYAISPIPMFLLMGILVFRSGIGADMYTVAYKWIGHFRGGLAMATVIAGALLASVTGHSGAAVVALSKMALPEMRKHGYSDVLASGCTAVVGTLAFLIPPSLAFIIYAILTEQSVGLLFMAGILPGILLAVLFLITVVIITALNPQAGPAGPKFSFKEKLISLKVVWPTLLIFLIVLGGIYLGVFTPTEAGAVGCFGAAVIAFSMRRLTLKAFYLSLFEAAGTSAMMILLMIGAYFFIKFIALSKLAFAVSAFVSGLTIPPMAVIVVIIFIYILLGMFLDIFGAVMLTIPVFYPIVVGLGFDPIWFGVLIVVIIEMGLVTPPIGFDVFMLSGASGIPITTIFRGVTPFVVAILVCIVLIVIFPEIALLIPNTM